MDKVIIFDYGSQYKDLIARRIRDCHVYAEIVPFNTEITGDLITNEVKGIILSGGPRSVNEKQTLSISKGLFDLDIPVLGICYGMQLIHQYFGGEVKSLGQREYGKAECQILNESLITKGLSNKEVVWMSHGDSVTTIAKDFILLGQTDSCYALTKHRLKEIYTMQFHPEVTHTEHGSVMIQNFLFEICHITPSWYMDHFVQEKVEEIKQIVKDQTVILALSGGVDSSVTALLLDKAIHHKLKCFFINTGLLRKNEVEEVMDLYQKFYHLDITLIDASPRFFKALKGIKNPEKKRKIIGNQFIKEFEEAQKLFTDATFLAQGTIYPDIIESSKSSLSSEVIKSHHNVGGLPSKVNFKILEPLSHLFKDEVRKVGQILGLPHDLLYRHPFPGPGLGIRCIGDINRKKIQILQDADDIFINALRAHQLYDKVGQAFVVLLPVKSVGVMGDQRTYEYTLVIRSVDTIDYMSASVSHLPFTFFEMITNKLLNEVKGINRVLYDFTTKPPGTIEWE